MHFIGVFLGLEGTGGGFGKVTLGGLDHGLGVRRGRGAEECELLSDGQVFKHVVLRVDFDREAKHGGQEHSVAHGALHEGGVRLIECEVAVQEVHALAEHDLHKVIREDEDCGQLFVLLAIVEGHKQVFLALHQLAVIA